MTMDSNHYDVLTDDSVMEDDDENDPDWRKTPLYSRIRKQEVIIFIYLLDSSSNIIL